MYALTSVDDLMLWYRGYAAAVGADPLTIAWRLPVNKFLCAMYGVDSATADLVEVHLFMATYGHADMAATDLAAVGRLLAGHWPVSPP